MFTGPIVCRCFLNDPCCCFNAAWMSEKMQIYPSGPSYNSLPRLVQPHVLPPRRLYSIYPCILISESLSVRILEHQRSLFDPSVYQITIPFRKSERKVIQFFRLGIYSRNDWFQLGLNRMLCIALPMVTSCICYIFPFDLFAVVSAPAF